MNPKLPTEAELEASRDLDQRSNEEIVKIIHDEDAKVCRAVERVLPQIVEAVDVLVCTLRGGGRWFNVGAGTSGRIGTLDAAEIPPTFGLPRSRVQAIMAGGSIALERAVENAEDHPEEAKLALQAAGLQLGDAVVALSASGYTPFALGALDCAHEAGARRIAITCDPSSPLVEMAEIAIAPIVGPEVLAGSTRMKGGLAQKMVLHTLSTTVMIKLGRVDGNLLSHLLPNSQKLKERALAIVMQRTGVEVSEARELLAQSNDVPAEAIARFRRNKRGDLLS